MQPVASHYKSDAFFFFFVRLVVTEFFAICDLSVLCYVIELNEETCAGA
jgi:hypothetical protein